MTSRELMGFGPSASTACLFRGPAWLSLLLASLIALPFCPAGKAADAQWIRPQSPGDPLIWGRTDGLVFGLPSKGGMPGPRGLIRVGIYSKEHRRPELVNYIAIEPVIAGEGSRFGRMAFSELELSQLDPGSRGKRLEIKHTSAATNFFRGEISRIDAPHIPSDRVEELSVPIDVERFTSNGAHVYVTASMLNDRPHELRLSVHAYPDSAPIEELTVTATMGNFEKLRVLWLKDSVVNSRELFSAYQGDNFVEHKNYTLAELLHTEDGDAIAIATSNEASPSSVFSGRAAPHWHYHLPRLTQYWRVPAHYIEPDLRIRVNGRRAYWASHDPIPGGPAFENFEVRQRYSPAQVFVFGLTTEEPWQFEHPIPHLAREHGIETEK